MYVMMFICNDVCEYIAYDFYVNRILESDML